MKKRTFAMALACAMSLSMLTACGGNEPTPEDVTNPSSQTEMDKNNQDGTENETPDGSVTMTKADLSALYNAIMESAGEDNAPFMSELTDDYVENIYPGLSEISLKQQVLYTAAISAVACEISMVECDDAADVEKVKEIFQARIDSQVDGGAWYPETIEKWEQDAKIVVNGNCVGLFVIGEDSGMMDGAAEFAKLS